MGWEFLSFAGKGGMCALGSAHMGQYGGFTAPRPRARETAVNPKKHPATRWRDFSGKLGRPALFRQTVPYRSII